MEIYNQVGRRGDASFIKRTPLHFSQIASVDIWQYAKRNKKFAFDQFDGGSHHKN